VEGIFKKENQVNRDTMAQISSMQTQEVTIIITGTELRALIRIITKSSQRRLRKRARREMKQTILKIIQMCKKPRSRNIKKLRLLKA